MRDISSETPVYGGRGERKVAASGNGADKGRDEFREGCEGPEVMVGDGEEVCGGDKVKQQGERREVNRKEFCHTYKNTTQTSLLPGPKKRLSVTCVCPLCQK